MNNLNVYDLKVISKKIFKNQGKFPIINIPIPRFSKFDDDVSKLSDFNNLEPNEKSKILSMICKDNYTESQIVYLQLNYTFSAGFALTDDSICIGGDIEECILKYSDIDKIYIEGDFLHIDTKTIQDYSYDLKKNIFLKVYRTDEKIKQYVEEVKKIFWGRSFVDIIITLVALILFPILVLSVAGPEIAVIGTIIAIISMISFL